MTMGDGIRSRAIKGGGKKRLNQITTTHFHVKIEVFPTPFPCPTKKMSTSCRPPHSSRWPRRSVRNVGRQRQWRSGRGQRKREGRNRLRRPNGLRGRRRGSGV